MSEILGTDFLRHHRFQILKLMLTEVHPIEKYLRGGVVMDVGANRGHWSAALLMYAGRRVGDLHLFEPLDKAREILGRVLEGVAPDRDYVLNACALGAETGEAVLHFEENDPASALATLSGDRANLTHEVRELRSSATVRVETLDAYCRERGIAQIDYLKLDAEGHELSILKGAQELLAQKRIQALSFEFGLPQLYGDRFRAHWDLLTGHGYKIALMKRGEGGYDTRPIPAYSTHLERYDWNRYYLAYL